MQNAIISNVLKEMVVELNNQQLKKLKDALEKSLCNLKIEKIYENDKNASINTSLIDSFISSTRVEGCSKKTIS